MPDNGPNNGIELAKAYVQIVPSAEGISGSIAKVLEGEGAAAGEGAGKAAGGRFGGSFKKAMTTVGVTAAAVTTAASAAVAKLAAGASEISKITDNIDKESQKLGISAEAYQEWDAILQHSGSSANALGSVMRNLTQAVEKGDDAFAAIGISAEQLQTLNREDLFAAVISGLQGMTDEQQRAVAAQDLLGRGAQELGALLNTSAADTEAMRQRVHELGGVLSDEAVKSGAAFQDNLQDLQTSIQGISNNLFASFLPGLTEAMAGLTDIFTGSGGLEQLSSGLSKFVGSITKQIPRVLEIGKDVAISLGQAILDNAGELVKAGLGVISSLASGIADALPELVPQIVDVVLEIVDVLTDPDTLYNLVEGAIAIILALADGLVKAVPRLLEKIPFIIKNLVSALTSNAPQIFAGALQLIMQLAAGLVGAIPQLVAEIPKIISAIVGGLAQGAGKIFEVGRDLLKSLWEGFKSMLSWIGEQIVGAFRGIWDTILDLLGIGSYNSGRNAARSFSSGWNSYGGSLTASAVTSGVRAYSPTSPYSASYLSSNATNVYNVSVDARNVREFNDVIAAAQNAQRFGRMYG